MVTRHLSSCVQKWRRNWYLLRCAWRAFAPAAATGQFRRPLFVFWSFILVIIQLRQTRALSAAFVISGNCQLCLFSRAPCLFAPNCVCSLINAFRFPSTLCGETQTRARVPTRGYQRKQFDGGRLSFVIDCRRANNNFTTIALDEWG
jgi:hypothetical protein